MLERTTDAWMKIFEELDIPCSLVNSMQDLLTEEHLTDVGLFYETDHPTEGPIRAIRSPFWVEGVAENPDAPAPVLARSGGVDVEPIAWKPRL